MQFVIFLLQKFKQYSRVECFPENLADDSEEQGERFHQDIKVMEQQYQER